MIKASIIGATGYAGIELVRLLSAHPKVDLVHLVSQSFVDQPVSAVYPNFKGILDKICSQLDIDQISEESDIIFTSLPHSTSDRIISALYEKGNRIIDLSADFRYRSAEIYEKWYGTRHARPDLLEASVYGLPELYREEIKQTRLIGNPGCYPTSALLPLAPLMAANAIRPDTIIIDSKSGSSGAGRSPSPGLHFCEVDENIKAYKVACHRHTSEIEQELGIIAKHDVTVSFTPHLLPVKRGILSTIYAALAKNLKFSDIYDIYTNFYCNEPFIVLHEEGSMPELKHVNGSNMCHIGFAVDNRTSRIIIVSAIDNLIKGASGQAIQSMNILFGIDETTGLLYPGWYL